MAAASSDSTDLFGSAASKPDAPADATPEADTVSTPPSSGSDGNDIINQFASSWEKTSADITSTTSTTADPFKNNWDGSSPSSATIASTPATDDKFQFSWDKPAAQKTDTSASTSSSDATNLQRK